ncbi:MAG: hypothetical protein QM520_04800, partial [Gammaproteobacteria bacterium]|nr:hypothetical protein [Gammaproteobacteria bacterium]
MATGVIQNEGSLWFLFSLMSLVSLIKTVAQPVTLSNYCVMYVRQFVALSIVLPLSGFAYTQYAKPE